MQKHSLLLLSKQNVQTTTWNASPQHTNNAPSIYIERPPNCYLTFNFAHLGFRNKLNNLRTQHDKFVFLEILILSQISYENLFQGFIPWNPWTWLMMNGKTTSLMLIDDQLLHRSGSLLRFFYRLFCSFWHYSLGQLSTSWNVLMKWVDAQI